MTEMIKFEVSSNTIIAVMSKFLKRGKSQTRAGYDAGSEIFLEMKKGCPKKRDLKALYCTAV